MLVSANITKQSITKEQKLNVIIEFLPETIDEKDGLSEVVCGIDVIQFDKDIYINPILHYSQVVDQRTKAININIDVSSLIPGVYCFYNLSVRKSDINGNEIEGYRIEYPDLLFEIREDMTSCEKTHYQLIEERDQLILRYNTMYNNGIGVERTSETIEYECYLFCSDIYIGKEMLLGKCDVFPYKSIDNRNIYDYIKDFVQNIGLAPLPDRDNNIDDYNPYTQPCAVIHYPVVIAHNPQEAGNITHEKAKLIINAFSVTNDSYGTIIGDLLIDKKNNKKYHRCMYSSYMGNLFVGMENPKKLFNLAECSESDLLKKFYLEIFIDCSREKRSKYAYFRFWNLLETISRNKNYIGKPKKDMNGNIILNKKLIPILIQDNV